VHSGNKDGKKEEEERDGKERGGKRVGRERRNRIVGRRQEVGQGGKRKGEKCEREERDRRRKWRGEQGGVEEGCVRQGKGKGKVRSGTELDKLFYHKNNKNKRKFQMF
jgi:hypothetical protein